MMKPFGKESVSYTYGYDLPMCLSHLEGLLEGEVQRVESKGGSKKIMTRIEFVERALALLSDAAEMGDEA